MKNNYPVYVKVCSFFTLIFYCSLSVSAQVGIGTTTPTATLHVKGEYVSPTTSTQNLFSEDFSNWPIGTNSNFSRTGNCSEGWVIQQSPTIPAASICTSCTGKMLYITSVGCTIDATAIVPFQTVQDPSAIAVTITFDFKKGGYWDELYVTLYNNTSPSSSVTRVVADRDRFDRSHTETFSISGTYSYSWHFNYIGNDDGQLTVDNIEVSEVVPTIPGSYAFRMDDNGAQLGAVLTSDGFGNAFWKAPSSPRPASSGTLDSELGTSSNSQKGNHELLIHELQKAVRQRQLVIEAREEKIETMEARINELE